MANCFAFRFGQLFKYERDSVSIRLGGIVPRTSWAKPYHKRKHMGRVLIESPEEVSERNGPEHDFAVTVWNMTLQ
jgi:hypothetical protein